MIISWDEYFMSIARLSALRSKDPCTQVGCCIVSPDKKIVSLGYNGMPYTKSKENDEVYSWGKQGDRLNTKFPYVVHAELNAILNSHTDLRGCILYCTLFPCHECCKAIIQSGISKVIYYEDEDNTKDTNKAAKIMFKNAGIEFAAYNKTNKTISLEV